MAKIVFWRIVAFEFIVFSTTLLFTNLSYWKTFDKKEILGVMISVISIIIAIIITYLFSKLFSEKGIMVDRKKEIDELSKKITYLRKIAFHIRDLDEFWQHEGNSVKSTIDYKYKKLTYEIYRGYDDINELSDDEFKQINKDIFGTDGQAYLALKGLEDKDNTYRMFTEFDPRNYSLDDIARYKEYSESFWYFLDNSSKEVYNFKKCNKYWLNSIDELYEKITGNVIVEYRDSLKDLFGQFNSEIFDKHFYLNRLNANGFSSVFKNSFLNMLLFLILLISAVFIFTIDEFQKFDYISTLLLLSLFISNTVDLIIITYTSIKSELDISDVYSI